MAVVANHASIQCKTFNNPSLVKKKKKKKRMNFISSIKKYILENKIMTFVLSPLRPV